MASGNLPSRYPEWNGLGGNAPESGSLGGQAPLRNERPGEGACLLVFGTGRAGHNLGVSSGGVVPGNGLALSVEKSLGGSPSPRES